MLVGSRFGIAALNELQVLHQFKWPFDLHCELEGRDSELHSCELIGTTCRCHLDGIDVFL